MSEVPLLQMGPPRDGKSRALGGEDFADLELDVVW